MCVALPGTFLAIFVPGLLWDEHIAPHDGQGGIGWFFLAVPISMLAALVAGPASYALSVKWGWFEPPKE
jgi:thiamine monophosphate kinase